MVNNLILSVLEWDINKGHLISIYHQDKLIAYIDADGFFHCEDRKLMVEVLRKEIYDFSTNLSFLLSSLD